MSNILLSLRSVSFSYMGESRSIRESTINDISLTVPKGEIICIVGASGCGKSTLLNIMAGLIQPHSGDCEISQELSSRKNPIGYIFQQDALMPWRTVRENITLPVEVSKILTPKDKLEMEIQKLLSEFHLDRKVLEQYPLELSGGMRQRVSIIQALITNPSLFLLDEPFSALDYNTKLKLESEFWHLVRQRHCSAVLVTHDIEEALALASRLYVMAAYPGRLHKIYDIEPEICELDPLEARSHPAFGDYFRKIWQDMKDLEAV